ncbi:hypothetical protein Tco_0051892 [Tanacetum coccineum]
MATIVIEDLKVLVSNVNDRSCEPYNANDVTDLLEQNERLRAEIEKVKQHYKEMFESIKITRTSTNEKTSSLLTQIEDLKVKLVGNLKVASRSLLKQKFLLLVITSTINSQKLAVHQKLNCQMSLVIPSTGVRSSTVQSGQSLDSNTKHNRPSKIWLPKGKLSDNSLNKTKQVWKATGKLFANVGYQWRPTGKKFALGELCPLTQASVVQIILWYLDSGCSKLDLEEEMAPIRREPSLGSTEVDKRILSSAFQLTLRQNTDLTGVYSFQVNEHWLTLSVDLLQKALNVTLADSTHPFELPPAGKMEHATDVQERQKSLLELHKPKKQRTMDECIFQRWIIASQDETTGPSVHPEDATSTNMVHETLSHANAESGGNSEKVGSNSEQSHVALAGPNPEHMHDVFLCLLMYPRFMKALKHTLTELSTWRTTSSSRTLSSMKNLEDS